MISSTPMSGTINSSGAFVATSSALLDDPTYGYMRVSYKLDGKISGSSWSGKYDFIVNAEDVVHP